jgi:cytochrome d ubiquinol oxidase subunit II
MTIVVVLFLPLVLAYQGWSFYVFRARVQAPPQEADRPPVPQAS